MDRVRQWLRELLRLNGTPRGIAGGVALGVGLSLVPIPALGMIVALALAPALRCNPPATYLGTAVVNPFTGPFFYFAELWLGLTLTGHSTPAFAQLRLLSADGWWTLFTELLGPFAIGAAVMITVSAALSYAVVYAATKRYQAHKHKEADAEAPTSDA